MQTNTTPSPPVVPPPETLYPFERWPWNRVWLWWLVTVSVVVADYFTSATLLFPIFFVVPVLLIAWHGRLSRALLTVLALSLLRVSFHFHWGLPWGMAAVFINAAIRWCVLSLLAVLTSRVAHQTRALRRRVRLLEGMLPICGFCKDIRDEVGQWNKLENYISRHSEVQFTTGICPECTEREYAAYREQRRGVGA